MQDEGNLYRSIHDVTNEGQNTKPSATPSMWTRIGNPLDEFPSGCSPSAHTMLTPRATKVLTPQELGEHR